MILAWLIVVPALGGILAWILGRWHAQWARWIALGAMLLDLALALALWVGHGTPLSVAGPGPWLLAFSVPWIPQLGISLSLGVDGLSLLLVLLTGLLGVLSVACSWTEVQEQVGFFHLNLLWVLAGILGVFLSLDLFLFYFFWEMMLVPMSLLIAIWGHERRVYAAMKFFLFTQVSGLLMLAAILGLYFLHGQASGEYSFGYRELLATPLTSRKAMWLMLGFLIAFAVKLPALPVHTWLPDAHTEAPTAGSVILAGLLLKTGAYGMLRFVLPLFPQAANAFAPIGMALGVAGILYAALLAFGQTDLKRLVAYTSVSHMGFVLLGVFAGTLAGLQGAMMQMLTHGLSTGALFILVGALQERIHTRDVARMGGLWKTAPRMGGVGVFFALASLGLPGLGNFVAEFLVLWGVYQVNVVLAAVAAGGLVAAAAYALRMIQVTFQGPDASRWQLPDLGRREMAVIGVLMAVILWLGLYPQPVLDMAEGTLRGLAHPAGLGRATAVRLSPASASAAPPLPVRRVSPAPAGGEP